MRPLKNIRVLLQPTLTSFATSLALSVMVVAAGLWFTDLRTGVLFNALTFGADPPAGTITSSQTTLADFNARLFGNPLLNKALFYSVWLLIGCLVYLLLTAMISFGSESVKTAAEMNYVNAKRGQLKRIFLSRLSVRLVAIGLEIAYIIVFLKLLLPYSIYAVHVAANQTQLLAGLLYIAGAMVALMASWHLHVVLVRLITLRTRLFSDD